MSLSDRQAWSARLDNGLTLLIGRDEGVAVNDRIARWVAVHPTVQARLNERVEVIDLRYPNGFAVRAPGLLDDVGHERGEHQEHKARAEHKGPGGRKEQQGLRKEQQGGRNSRELVGRP